MSTDNSKKLLNAAALPTVTVILLNLWNMKQSDNFSQIVANEQKETVELECDIT